MGAVRKQPPLHATIYSAHVLRFVYARVEPVAMAVTSILLPNDIGKISSYQAQVELMFDQHTLYGRKFRSLHKLT